MMATAECLFVVSQSSEPYSILLLDPDTGGSKWAFRGSELQSNKIQYAVFLGEHQSHLCVALADKPIIISVPMKEHRGNGKNTFCTKSILSLNPSLLVSHPSGDFMFIAAENKLFTWEIFNGQLLSIVEEHVRSITVLKISACGNYLASASKDGAVKIFLTANLITTQGLAQIQPIGGHNCHTLPVNDLFISNGTNLRILTVSDDHVALLFSLTTQQILLKLSTNQPLTSCCMDPAETKIFIGSITGGIRIIDIQTEFKSGYHRMNGNENPAEKNEAICKGKFENHESAISGLSLNADGTRLASADRDGLYYIWDISNGQCLRSGKMNGPIASLDFVQNYMPKQSEEGGQNNGVHIPLVSSLQKHLPSQRRLKVSKHVERTKKDDVDLKTYCNSILEKINNGQFSCIRNEGLIENEEASKYKKRRLVDDEPNATATLDAQTEELNSLKERIAEDARELARVTQINSEMYQYIVKNFVGGETN